MKTSNKLNTRHRIAKLYTYLTNDELKSDSVQIIQVRSRFRQKDQRRISVLERYHLTRYHDLCDVQVVIRPPIFLGGVGEVRNIAISFFCICVHAVYVSCQLSSILPENIIYSMWTPKNCPLIHRNFIHSMIIGEEHEIQPKKKTLRFQPQNRIELGQIK